MARYTTTVDAFQLPARGDEDTGAFMDWAREVGFTGWESGRDESIDMCTSSPDGRGFWTNVAPEDWVVKDADGVFVRLESEAFERNYTIQEGYDG